MRGMPGETNGSQLSSINGHRRIGHRRIFIEHLYGNTTRFTVPAEFIYKLTFVCDAQFVVNNTQMVFHCPFRDIQLLPYLPVVHSVQQTHGDLLFLF